MATGGVRSGSEVVFTNPLYTGDAQAAKEASSEFSVDFQRPSNPSLKSRIGRWLHQTLGMHTAARDVKYAAENSGTITTAQLKEALSESAVRQDRKNAGRVAERALTSLETTMRSTPISSEQMQMLNTIAQSASSLGLQDRIDTLQLNMIKGLLQGAGEGNPAGLHVLIDSMGETLNPATCTMWAKLAPAEKQILAAEIARHAPESFKSFIQEDAGSANGVFRGNGEGSKLVTNASIGMLKETIAECERIVTKELNANPEEYKGLSEMTDENGDKQIVKGESLLMLCKAVFPQITEAFRNLPEDFIALTQLTRQAAEAQFSKEGELSATDIEATRTGVIANNAVLRTINPSISTLHTREAGLRDRSKAISLLSKVIQNTANHVQFGGKESQMTFIEGDTELSAMRASFQTVLDHIIPPRTEA